jgi:hypothetical protein
MYFDSYVWMQTVIDSVIFISAVTIVEAVTNYINNTSTLPLPAVGSRLILLQSSPVPSPPPPCENHTATIVIGKISYLCNYYFQINIWLWSCSSSGWNLCFFIILSSIRSTTDITKQLIVSDPPPNCNLVRAHPSAYYFQCLPHRV